MQLIETDKLKLRCQMARRLPEHNISRPLQSQICPIWCDLNVSTCFLTQVELVELVKVEGSTFCLLFLFSLGNESVETHDYFCVPHFLEIVFAGS